MDLSRHNRVPFREQEEPVSRIETDERHVVSEGTPVPTAHGNLHQKGTSAPNATSSKPRFPLSTSMETVGKAQEVLLGLRHAWSCQATPGTCMHFKNNPNRCLVLRRIYRHVKACCLRGNQETTCNIPLCQKARRILSHYHDCTNPLCPLCIPLPLHCGVWLRWSSTTASPWCWKQRNAKQQHQQQHKLLCPNPAAALPAHY